VKIRDAVEEDLPAIVEIYNSTVPGRMVNWSSWDSGLRRISPLRPLAAFCKIGSVSFLRRRVLS